MLHICKHEPIVHIYRLCSICCVFLVQLDECEHKTDTLMMEIFRRGIER